MLNAECYVVMHGDVRSHGAVLHALLVVFSHIFRLFLVVYKRTLLIYCFIFGRHEVWGVVVRLGWKLLLV